MTETEIDNKPTPGKVWMQCVSLAALLAVSPLLPAFAENLSSSQSSAKAYELYNVANHLVKDGQPQSAIPLYRKAISLSPNRANYYVNLGVALRRVGDYKEAEQATRKAAQMTPNNWEVWSNLANVLHAQKKYEEELDALEHALKFNPPKAEKDRLEKLKFEVEWQVSGDKSRDSMSRRK